MNIFGDIRLERVKNKLLSAMEIRQTVVIRQLAENRKAEMSYGRYLNNDSVSPEAIVKSHSSVFNALCESKHVLLVEDTTIASFGLHSQRGEMGYVGKSSQISGFNMHPVIGLDAEEGGCLGLFGLKVWQRSHPIAPQLDSSLDKATLKKLKAALKKAKRKDLWKQPFEQKEYYKWYSAIEQAVANCPNAEKYTVISDREGDVYEALCGYSQKGWHYVVRSSYDRKLSCDKTADKNTPKTLHKALDTWSIQGSYSLDLPKTDKRSAHKAAVDVKFGQVSIECPNWTIKQKYDKHLPLYVIEVKEQPQTVVNGEKPIHWILMTSHKVETLEQALIIIQWYRWRWVIEQIFRTLKSQGLNIEQSEVESYEALINLATMALLAAVLVMQLVQARDGTTQQNINDFFTPIEVECLVQLSAQLEGNTDKQKNPHPKNDLAFASWVIARLGGWSGYLNQRPPGPITMRNGIVRFYDILQGFTLKLQN
jgi:hypothetical protein